MIERDLVAVAQGVSDDRRWAFDDQIVQSAVAGAEIAQPDLA